MDLKLRTEMQYELRELQKRLGITFIFVTHDQEEALALSDYIFVMKDGKIQQFGTPTDIYDEPVNRFVADFIGESNIVEGKMVEDFVVNIYGQDFECVDAGIPSGKNVEVVIRPEDISLIEADKGLFKATVDSMLFRGVHYEICCIDRKGYEWVIQTTKKAEVGSEVGLYFDPEAIHIMVPGETEENLINVLKVMRSLTMRNINKVLIIPYLLWMVLFIIVPVILLVYFSFTDLNGHFSLTNYEQILSMKYLKMMWDSIFMQH